MRLCGFYICGDMDKRRTLVWGFSLTSSVKLSFNEIYPGKVVKKVIPITNQSDLGEMSYISRLMSHKDVSGRFRWLLNLRRITPEYTIFYVGKCEITHMPLSLKAGGY